MFQGKKVVKKIKTHISYSVTLLQKSWFLWDDVEKCGDNMIRRHCATNRQVAGSIPDGVIEIFSVTYSFRSHYGPGVDSASNRNEYQVYFLGVKAAGA